MNPTEMGVIFQVPKFEAKVELLLADNRRLNGRIFLPILTSNPLGHTPLLDWMNEQSDFFPFLPDNSKDAEILSKQALVEAIVNTDLYQSEIDEIMEQTVWVEQIEVHCDPYVVLNGNVLLNLPPGRSRVLDYLNQSTRFFAVRNGSRSHLINKRFVTGVKELPSIHVQEPVADKNSAASRKRRSAKK